MNKFLAKLMLSVFLSTSGMAWAANWYVDPLASGSNNGTSWTNAWTSFSAVNWGSVNPGDTVYLSGGVTSQQYNAQLTVGKSGSSAGRITISVGQDAGHNGTVIIDGGGIGGSRDGINFRNYNYLNFEGNYGGQRHLLIQNTNGCISNYGNNGGSASGGHHVRIEYVECSGTYEGLVVTHGAGDGGVEINNNYIHNVQDNESVWVISSASASSYGQILVHDNIINPNYSDGSGSGADGVQGSCCVSVYNNSIFGIRGSHTTVQHQDGVQALGEYWRIYNNDFHDLGNSCVYVDFFGGSQVLQHIMIYNNTVRLTDRTTLNGYERGIELENEGSGSYNDVHVLSNTIVDFPNYIGLHLINHSETSFTNVEFQNNIVVNADMVIDNSSSAVVVDYNDVPGGVQKPANSTYTQAHNRTAVPSFASYVAYNVNNDLHLASSDSAATNQGVNLYSEFTVDKDGKPRPATGLWDIGAYDPSTSTSQAPQPPTGVVAVAR